MIGEYEQQPEPLMVNTRTFDEWRQQVNVAVLKQTEWAMGLEDLVDWTYHDAWSAGTEPEDAAEEAIANDDIASQLVAELRAERGL